MKPPRLNEDEAKILGALLRFGPMTFVGIREKVPSQDLRDADAAIESLQKRDLASRSCRGDDDFFRYYYAPTPLGYEALARHRPKRPGFLRRSWRRLRAVPCWYADEWRNDWLSMALSHVLLLSTLSLAALSAWGVIP